MSRLIATGIDVGTAFIRVVVAEQKKGDTSTKILGVGIAESKGMRHGYVVNPKETSKSIRAAIQLAQKNAKVPIKSAFVSMSGISLSAALSQSSVIISKADGEITDIDIKKVISTAEEKLDDKNQQLLHSIPLRFMIDGKEILGRPNGLRGIKFEAKMLCITSLSQHADDLVNVIQDSGIAVEDIMAAPIAASLVTLSRQQKTAGCVLANIGSETVSICVFENNLPVSLEVFPIGSTDITNDIALGLKISLDEAERIKLGDTVHAYSEKRLNEIIEARLSDIFELIEAHLRKIRRNGLLPAGIVLTGGGVSLRNIADLAKISLKLPAQIAEPQYAVNSGHQIHDSSWAVAYGLCVWGLDSDEESAGLQLMKKTQHNVASWFKQFLP
ncbi:MAG: cell division protein FtsA [Candidatus Lloydbacteria bacterium]|nr:cell division protein FtsA [Candidatus Lloydbacteria bacterium]